MERVCRVYGESMEIVCREHERLWREYGENIVGVRRDVRMEFEMMRKSSLKL